ncbi:hypothetical protein [Campylobacter troglodytis]|uniref:hypothetical protein n=1 Tax=Campylobacter troglodytis TaxID=654363 RepID=UPI0011590C31|nr:hypothetical protein [Campylobacter troglodytis]TQR60806.1 hypothetical protein DMC01_04115 [Campylobacter troglodytis]
MWVLLREFEKSGVGSLIWLASIAFFYAPIFLFAVASVAKQKQARSHTYAAFRFFLHNPHPMGCKNTKQKIASQYFALSNLIQIFYI